MKLYNTYKEAKEAHPDCDAVVTTGEEWMGPVNCIGKFDAAFFVGGSYRDRNGYGLIISYVNWVIAEPPKEGEFKNGDVVYHNDERLIWIDYDGISSSVCRSFDGLGYDVFVTSHLTKTPPLKEGWYLCESIESGCRNVALYYKDGELRLTDDEFNDDESLNFTISHKPVRPMTIGDEL